MFNLIKEKMTTKQYHDLKIKINNARTIGGYFTKEEVMLLTLLVTKEESAK
tara:strand:+ start:105 stop:257 length:153 start_codon:yes stop_codon:yes gene_type:complete